MGDVVHIKPRTTNADLMIQLTVQYMNMLESQARDYAREVLIQTDPTFTAKTLDAQQKAVKERARFLLITAAPKMEDADNHGLCSEDNWPT